MQKYLVKRLLLIIPTLIGITLITFVITRFVPGGPIEKYLIEQQLNTSDKASFSSGISNITRQGLTEDDLVYLKQFYGFDKSWWEAYIDWSIKVLTFDLGTSYRFSEPVTALIAEKLPVSVYYGLTTTLLIYLISIPLGVYKALRDGKPGDIMTSVLIYMGYAVPGYVLGILLQTYIAGQLGWFPAGGFISADFEELSLTEKAADIAAHSFLPLICYTIGGFAGMTVMMKTALMENIKSEYVKTAYAKGLKKPAVIWGHVMRNSLLPLMSTIGRSIGLILTGSFLIERIFNINGLGLLGYTSLTDRDYPVVLGILYISALLFLIGNILSDICVAFTDPRIQFN